MKPKDVLSLDFMKDDLGLGPVEKHGGYDDCEIYGEVWTTIKDLRGDTNCWPVILRDTEDILHLNARLEGQRPSYVLRLIEGGH